MYCSSWILSGQCLEQAPKTHGAVIVLLVFTFALADGRIPFFIQNFLSLLVLVAIAIQAYIYRRQWEVMEQSVVGIGDAPGKFNWRDTAAPVKRSFIPGKEDRTFPIPYLGSEHLSSVNFGEHSLFLDGEARYSTLGDREIILSFGATWDDTLGDFVVGYQFERDAESTE